VNGARNPSSCGSMSPSPGERSLAVRWQAYY
jgi:hypothetical protein